MYRRKIMITTFGEFTRFLRENVLHGMTRREFCRITKIPDITCQKWEYGKAEPPEWALVAMVDHLVLDVFREQIPIVPREIMQYRKSIRGRAIWPEK